MSKDYITQIYNAVTAGQRIGQACYNAAHGAGLVAGPMPELFYQVDDWNDIRVREIMEVLAP